ncbi:acyltransferase family protein [Streptomyces flavofungini]|uniref:acyltransferase family protein n=1 Tax=Streptomyces flavofungini TaxID=68200 RepID=UPI0025AF1C55|nr:acyltransferase [Streptomyces flavofungini]WJV45644.1 acyltransferase [Streptomyces flavofungini]
MHTASGSDAPSQQSTPRSPTRLDWLDNLRVALTVLVVIHHAAQPYGPADWWYVEDQPRTGPLATLSALDGSFFMSLFFFASAVFVPVSCRRRGGRAFLKGRLLRLGIPLTVGALTIVPGLMYAYYVHYRGLPSIAFPRYFTDVYLGLGDEPADWSGPSWPDLQFGHLWFIQNLLAYSLLYVLCRWLARLLAGDRERARSPRAEAAPGHRHLLLLATVIAVASFLIRLAYPLDEWVPFLDILQVEPARFPQYAAFFTLGVLASRRDWLERFDARVGWVWLAGGAAGAAALFAVGADADCFGPGGLDTPSALWAAYDSALCVSLCVGFLALFREAVTRRGRLQKELAAGAYAVYVIHLPLVVTAQYFLADRALPPVTAWLIVSGLAVPASFLLAAGLRRLPGARRVL